MRNMTGGHRKAFWVGKDMCKHSDFKIWTLPMGKVVVQNDWNIGAGIGGDPRKVNWNPNCKKPYIPLS